MTEHAQGSIKYSADPTKGGHYRKVRVRFLLMHSTKDSYLPGASTACWASICTPMLPSLFHMYEYNNTPCTRLSSSLRPLLVLQLACTLPLSLGRAKDGPVSNVENTQTRCRVCYYIYRYETKKATLLHTDHHNLASLIVARYSCIQTAFCSCSYGAC